MKALIIGNMGYVGSVLVRHLRKTMPQWTLVGYDTGYFSNCLSSVEPLPETLLDQQLFGDIREFPAGLLKGFDAVIHLAAISNDPMGDRFADVTHQINQEASAKIARLAKDAGVSRFVFASSCSVYGFAEDGAHRDETSPINPLTHYAKSKVYMENTLRELADANFNCTVLRFATACGMSPRVRLDLVLNDFVASALLTGKIKILSDGTPWRPLIDVKDMVLAISWGLENSFEPGKPIYLVNAGTNKANYQVKDLAKIVAQCLPGTEIDLNKAAAADKRSYRVDFSLYNKLAPNHVPRIGLEQSVLKLIEGLRGVQFKDGDFRNSHFIRLHVLDALIKNKSLSEDLIWNRHT